MVIRRNVLFLAVTVLTAVACTQVLGIEDRSLRPGSESSTGDGLGQADSGDKDSGPFSDAGKLVTPRDDAALVTGTDPARAVFSAANIDFGLVSCGAGAPPNRTLTISNTGDFELDWQATLSTTSSFAILGASAGPVAGQSFATVTLASSGYPSFATANQSDEATLTVQIMIVGQPTTSKDFTITETAAGASLALNPGVAAFGQVQVGTEASVIPVDLKNTGNVATTLSFGTSIDPQFSLISDAGAMVLGPGESLSGLVAKFLPASATSSTSSIAIAAGGSPMCGVAPTALHLTGAGTTGPITVQPGSLDFGLVNCGAIAVAQQITMSTTGAAFSWSASLGKGASSPYSISPASGTAIAGSPVVFTVTPHAVPSASAITADLYADNLTIVASDGTHVIPLHETAQGAILSQSTSSAAFGGVNTGTVATSSWNVVNDGNASAVVSYSIVNGAFVIAPQGQTLGGNGYSSSTTVTFSPTTTTAYSGSATMTVPAGTVLCAPLPAAVALSGTGTKSEATVTPSSLDFGLVKCGSTGNSNNVTITNISPSISFNWTATLAKGAASPYSLGATSGNIKAGKALILKVSPSAIPQISPVTSDHYADTLTITTDAPNDATPHVIALHETAQGVILALSPTTLAFGNVASNSSSSLPFQITNSGNLPAQVSLALGFGGFLSYSVDPATSTTVNGGSSVAGTATFHPKAPTGAKSTTITASFFQTNCGGAVSPITLSGSGT